MGRRPPAPAQVVRAYRRGQIMIGCGASSRSLQETAMILIPVVLVIGGFFALVLYLDKRAPF
jgi:hypothetical protein